MSVLPLNDDFTPMVASMLMVSSILNTVRFLGWLYRSMARRFVQHNPYILYIVTGGVFDNEMEVHSLANLNHAVAVAVEVAESPSSMV